MNLDLRGEAKRRDTEAARRGGGMLSTDEESRSQVDEPEPSQFCTVGASDGSPSSYRRSDSPEEQRSYLPMA